MFPILLPSIGALIVSMLLHRSAIRLFPKWNLLDHPEKYGHARKRLPYPTGIITVITFIVIFTIMQLPLSRQDGGLILAIIILVSVTMTDDIRGLPAWLRLIIQLIIGLIIFAAGTQIYTITNPLGGIISLDTIDITIPPIPNLTITPTLLPVYSGIFTILWLLLTMNAFNWFDGIPGQVSILSIIGSLTLGFLALSDRVNQPEIAFMAFLITGLAIACALFDFPPNRVLMGDSGSMFFGLMLGTLSIYAGGKVATAFLVFGLPLIDSFFVIFRRIIKRQSPFHGDRDHLHHRLLAKGWSERAIISLTAILGTIFGLSALFMSTQEKFFAGIILAGIILLLTRYARPHSDQTPTAHPAP